MQIPQFDEAYHPLVTSLSNHSDLDLVKLFQYYPEEGKYFVAIFCRYSSTVYTLVKYGGRSPTQTDYLFAITWRHIYYEMMSLEVEDLMAIDTTSLQSWIINMTANCVNQADIPAAEAIKYSVTHASPPLWCYLEQALDKLPPISRLIVLLSQTYHWNEVQISSLLQTEGENLSPSQVEEELRRGYQLLQAGLPIDIQQIYLDVNGLATAKASQNQPVHS
ncbi:RNA polymerase subunit sigma-70 [Merismopedia glauca]|uniref:RNA polymerase subunit sigma-70 n=1 Tax=Merismopedia glauca CCAP 1448/3 TaxID=1296344 RepID=A0A2T1CAM7_9CYAN|nr:RNA polymerase subunit sigma-70 [Merismopedia glauca]PSB05203.1 RNA polymerase subunit sigma-70 [Merismopedia glauca CCAP 1448/3]